MAEQKILISIQINDRETKKTNEALKVTKQNFDKLTKAEQDAIVADKQLSLSAKELDKSLTQKAAAANAAAKATDNMRATSGLNNAIIMETSRLASDASYGFTAIANNLSQLINLFQSQVTATGSLASTFKNLISVQSLVLISVQLLITYLPKLMDVLKEIAKAGDETKFLLDVFKNVGEEVESSSGRFEVYIKTIQDANRSQKEQNEALKLLKKEFPDYIDQLDAAGVSLKDVADNTDLATKQNDLYRESLIKLAMSRASMNKIEEISGEIITKKTERQLKLNELGIEEKDLADEKAKADKKNFSEFSEQSDIQYIQKINDLAATKEAHFEFIEQKEKEINALYKFTDVFDLESKKQGASRKRRDRVFKMADLDYEKEIQKSQERIRALTQKDEQELINIKFDGIAERAVMKQQEFEQDQERRLKDFLANTTDLAKRKDAQDKYDEEIRASAESLTEFLFQNNQERNAKLLELAFDQNRALTDAFNDRITDLAILSQEERDASILNEGIKARNMLDREMEVNQFKIDAIQQRLDTEQLSFQQRMKLEQEQTKLEDANSRARITIAETEAQAKRQALEVTADALMAFSKLAGQETGAGKALAVAGTLISTYLSAQKAYESQFKPIAIADSPVRGAIAAAAAVASGLANVKAILKVKTPNDKGASVGAATTIKAPDFNVVGASQTSQLAETVAGQQAKPIKAFVVGKDISSQQELDRNITNTASFG